MKIGNTTTYYHDKSHLLSLVGRPIKLTSSKYSRIYRNISNKLLIFMVMAQIILLIGSNTAMAVNKPYKEYSNFIPYMECNQRIDKYVTELHKMHNELQKLRRILDVYVEIDHKLLIKEPKENLDGY